MQKEIRHKQKKIYREEMKARSKEEQKRTKQATRARRAVGGPVHLYRAVDVGVPTGHQADDLRGDTSRGG